MLTRPPLRPALLIAVVLFTGSCSGSPSAPASTSTTTTTTPATTTPSAPVLTAINPSASDAGGVTVTITGTGFTNATAVTFGDTSAAAFTVSSDTSITATAPDCSTPGTVDVTVTTSVGTSALSSADQFTCGQNRLTAIWVNASSVKGGASLVGSVSLIYTAASGYVLPLTVSSDPPHATAAQVPSSVIVNAGSKVGTFVITTSPVSSRQHFVITTIFSGQTQSTSFYVEP
jgi:IPT/TIG domain